MFSCDVQPRIFDVRCPIYLPSLFFHFHCSSEAVAPECRPSAPDCTLMECAGGCGNGFCNGTTGACVCSYGWTGANCDEAVNFCAPITCTRAGL